MRHRFILPLAPLLISVALVTSCSSSRNDDRAVQRQDQSGPQNRGGQRPSTAEIFAQMDQNQDGKLAKSEVRGPLANDFSKVDTNGDAFISRTELENAPKPQGGRPPQR